MKPVKLSYQDKIALWLNSRRGEWVKSYELDKVMTPFGWLGSSSSRRARELAEKGSHTIGGVKYHIQVRHTGKYAEYQCIGGEKKEQKIEQYQDQDKNWITRIKQETLKV